MSLSVLYLCVFEALVFEWSSCTRLKGINHVPRCSFLVKTWLTQNLACFLVSGQRKCDETWDVIHLSLTLEEIHRSNFEHARQWVDFLSVRSVVRSSYLCSSVSVFVTFECVFSSNEEASGCDFENFWQRSVCMTIIPRASLSHTDNVL